MNLFELATFLSPVLGIVGGFYAADRYGTSSSLGMIAAVPVGLICGLACYRILIRLFVGKHDNNPNLPAWRAGAILAVAGFGPWLSALLSFGLVRLILYIASQRSRI